MAVCGPIRRATSMRTDSETSDAWYQRTRVTWLVPPCTMSRKHNQHSSNVMLVWHVRIWCRLAFSFPRAPLFQSLSLALPATKRPHYFVDVANQLERKKCVSPPETVRVSFSVAILLSTRRLETRWQRTHRRRSSSRH
jgi:hypothetical protein